MSAVNLAVAVQFPVWPSSDKKVEPSQDKRGASSTVKGQYCWNAIGRGLINAMHKIVYFVEVQDDKMSGDNEGETSGDDEQNIAETGESRIEGEHRQTARQQGLEKAKAAVIAELAQAIDYCVANSSSDQSSQAQEMTVAEATIDVCLCMNIFELDFESLRMYNMILTRFFTTRIGRPIRRRQVEIIEPIQERRANCHETRSISKPSNLVGS